MSSENQELYSLLIPLADERLIVPRACVAEVVRFTAPEQEAGAHDWMMGTVNWNGRALPVVSFEGALGKEKPVVTGRTRIVVFYASTGQLKTGFFGVLTQGFPQLVGLQGEQGIARAGPQKIGHRGNGLAAGSVLRRGLISSPPRRV